MTCPYHLSLPSLIFIPNRFTLTVPLINSFLILPRLVTPMANLNIFISATSISSTCFFVTATVSSPYIIAGLTTELYTFPFTLAGNLLLQITPDTFLHSFHPACPLFFTSLSQLPLSCTVDPKYLEFLYPPSSLFRRHFLHLFYFFIIYFLFMHFLSITIYIYLISIFIYITIYIYIYHYLFIYLFTDIRSLTYLLSSVFFSMHTSCILVSAPLLPWSLRKSQYHQQTASSTVVLSLLHPLACPLSLQTGTDLTLILVQYLETFCSSYCTPHHCFAFLVHILYKSHILFPHS